VGGDVYLSLWKSWNICCLCLYGFLVCWCPWYRISLLSARGWDFQNRDFQTLGTNNSTQVEFFLNKIFIVWIFFLIILPLYSLKQFSFLKYSDDTEIALLMKTFWSQCVQVECTERSCRNRIIKYLLLTEWVIFKSTR